MPAAKTTTSRAAKAKGPALTAGAAAAGLAGGLVLGSRSRRRGLSGLLAPRRRVLGIPLGRRSPLIRAAQGLGQVAHGIGTATGKASATTEDIHQIREQLDKANRQSPLEVVLDGLTHRRGAHKRES
jgi:hypothetical protein